MLPMQKLFWMRIFTSQAVLFFKSALFKRRIFQKDRRDKIFFWFDLFGMSD